MIQVRIIMQSFILRQKKSSFRKKVFYNKNAAVLLSKNNKDLIISQNLMYSLWLKIQQKLIFWLCKHLFSMRNWEDCVWWRLVECIVFSCWHWLHTNIKIAFATFSITTASMGTTTFWKMRGHFHYPLPLFFFLLFPSCPTLYFSYSLPTPPFPSFLLAPPFPSLKQLRDLGSTVSFPSRSGWSPAAKGL